jgi:hypothetical protein
MADYFKEMENAFEKTLKQKEEAKTPKDTKPTGQYQKRQ